mmetsp:Transcript_63648/g.177045  ORF Transcript_63648/g.177045 Transcript_63648/m.177045 type:complete len:262 (-) Transcript_63648:253-1038(-)
MAAGQGPGRRLHVPDHTGVLADGPVGGELAHAGRRLDAEASPRTFVGVRGINPRLRVHVGGEVVAKEVLVALPSASRGGVAEEVDDLAELRLRLLVAEREVSAADGCENLLHTRVDRVVAFLGSRFDACHLVFKAAEDEHGVMAALLADLDVRAVHCADDEAAVHHELHVGGPTRLRARRRNVLRYVRGGADRLGNCDAVVGQKCHLQVGRDVWILVHDPRNVADELDDGLGPRVPRGSLAAYHASPLHELGTVTGRRALD